MGRFFGYKPLQFKDYSSRKFFLSIVLGLTGMVTFYFFQQYIYVLFRSVVLALEFNANHILPEELGNLVALIFAGNAVILGNSVAISFYISGVSKTGRKRFRKMNVINNQSFLIGTYFYLFVKAVVPLGILLMLLSNSIEIADTWSIYTLLFIVLFLESVKELRRSFKGYSIKILVLHFLVITGLGVTCAFVSKANYYKLGIIYNTSSPYVSIPTTILPVSYMDRELILRYNAYQRVPVKVLSNSGELIYKVHRDTLSIDELLSAPYNERYNYAISYGRVASINIYADGHIAYNNFKALEERAILRGVDKIQYVVFSTNESREFTYTKNIYPTEEMLKDTIYSLPEKFRYFGISFKDKIEVPIAIDTFKIKNRVDQQKVYSYFYKSVSDSVFFKFHIHEEITLQHYLDFMISYKQSVYDLRDEQRQMNSALNNYMINEKEKYPFYFIENIE